MEKGREVDFPTLLTSQVQVARAFCKATTINQAVNLGVCITPLDQTEGASCSHTLLAGSQMNNVQTGLGAVKVGADVGGKWRLWLYWNLNLYFLGMISFQITQSGSLDQTEDTFWLFFFLRQCQKRMCVVWIEGWIQWIDTHHEVITCNEVGLSPPPLPWEKFFKCPQVHEAQLASWKVHVERPHLGLSLGEINFLSQWRILWLSLYCYSFRVRCSSHLSNVSQDSIPIFD